MYFKILNLIFLFLLYQYLNSQEDLNSNIAISVKNGDHKEILCLLEKGESPFSCTESGTPIISLAIYKGRLGNSAVFFDIIKALVEAGCDVNAPDKLGRTPLDILMMPIPSDKVSSIDEEIIDIKFVFDLQKLLLSRGAKHSADWLDRSKNRFVKDGLIP